MNTHIENGTIRKTDGVEHIFYDDYWIRYYPPPALTEAIGEKR
ncbi:hypothetical protein [Candidatus Spongiihabitans sp.]